MLLSIEDAERLCVSAARSTGASDAVARSLARATVAAEAAGQRSVGLAHFIDYLDALKAGRIDGAAQPEITRPTPAVIQSDARGGIAHLGFDLCFNDLAAAARAYGVAIFSQKNSYTAGALGWFASRLAETGLIAFSAANGPALLAGSGTTRPVFCTNPLAFAAPRANGPPLLIDQSSSATAFVNVRAAAERGEAIPQGWAIDANGHATTDPSEAMRGALMAFGGARGANIALMVEVLAAGLSSANWSLDAPSFSDGSESPGSGLFVLAISPHVLGDDFAGRLDAHLQRLERDYGMHVPGQAKAQSALEAGQAGTVVDADIVAAIRHHIA